MIDQRILADALLNLFGAAGLVLALLVFRARDPHGALTRRFTGALGLVALFFFLRGIAWWSASQVLERLILACAAVIPLATLLVVEAVQRRHAPRALKLALLAGTLGLVVLALVLDPWTTPVLLAPFQIAAFVACGVLLWRQPAEDLDAGEARIVRRLAVSAFVLLPFVASDFPSLWPAAPVRAGALGALLVVISALVADAASETRRGHAVLLGVRLGTGLVLGLALATLYPGAGWPETVRLVAVTLAGVLVIGLLTETMRAYVSAGEPGILNAVAEMPGAGREELLERLMRTPLFDGAVRLDETGLADYDPDIIRPHLAGRLVLRRADHPWGLRREDPVAERLMALLQARQASHIVVAGTAPLDLLAVRIPLIRADRATETGLLLAGRLIAATRAA